MPEQKYKFAEMALRFISLGSAVTYICEASRNYAPIFISANIQKQLGYTPEEFMADPDFWASQLHPDD